MTPTQLLWNFLKPICQQDGIEYVAMSDGDRMDRSSAASVSQTVYPSVFVMRPRYRVRDTTNGLIMLNYELKIYILAKGDLNDFESQDSAFDFCEGVATNILQELNRKYLEEKTCWFDLNDSGMDPVMYVTLDSAWGYELTIRLGLESNQLFYWYEKTFVLRHHRLFNATGIGLFPFHGFDKPTLQNFYGMAQTTIGLWGCTEKSFSYD